MALTKNNSGFSFPGDGSPEDLFNFLSSEAKPLKTRVNILKHIIMGQMDDDKAIQHILSGLCQRLASADPENAATKVKERYQKLVNELEAGPLRPATYVGKLEGLALSEARRVCVVTPDGQERYPVVPEEMSDSDMTGGTTVYLDAQGTAVLGASGTVPQTGTSAEFLRLVPDTDDVEVRLRDERFVLRASDLVLEAIVEDELQRGGRVLISPTREFAFRPLPGDTDRKYRFVDTRKLPDVVAGRDIGSPHWSLGYLIRRMNILMFRQDLLDSFDMRPRVSLLMTGPSGVGKTLHLRGFLTEFKRMIEKRTGRGDVGSRVIRVKAGEQLSEWLGRSDKNFEELFDDIYALASEEVRAESGELTQLPIVVILEEVEALGRRRGGSESGVHDRILGTMLQRMDDPTDDLAKLPIVFIATTNRADLMDSALVRRLAAMRAHFPRLDRAGFTSVLEKKIKPTYPMASMNGHSPDELRRGLLDQVVGWLYSPNGEDTGLVELTLADGKKMTKYRRDFLTGALVEQAVSNMIDNLVLGAEEEDDTSGVGFTAAALIHSFRQQIDGVADTLTSANAVEYVDIPEHASVATVRRLESSADELVSMVATPA